jgi:hypothetical protein
MSRDSTARVAYCNGIIAKQSRREIKAEPSPDAMRRLRELVTAYGMDLFDILERYIRGGLSAESAQDLFLSLATDSHRAAHILGQEVAAVQVVVPGLAADLGQMLGLSELSYFRGFLAALDGTDARYFDAKVKEWRMDQVARRAGMYTPKVESSASWGWVDNHEAQQQFNWILGVVDHCEDCPVLADQSPYYRETLYTVPREGQTECMGGCKCRVETVEGVAAFDPVELNILSQLGFAKTAPSNGDGDPTPLDSIPQRQGPRENIVCDPVAAPIDAPSSPRLVLSTGAQVPLTPGRFELGREVAGLLVMPQDLFLSRRHAQFDWDGAHLTVTDLGSTNGTYVRGTQISGPTPILPGDIVQCGETVIRFEG